MNKSSTQLRRFSTTILLGGCLLFGQTSWAAMVTDIVDRQVEIPDKVERVLLGEGRLFYAVSLLEGQQPFKRIIGWQGDFRKLDPQTYSVYRAKFPEIDAIPLIGNTTADSVSAEKVLTLNPDVAIFGLSGHGPGKDSELVKQLEKVGIPVVFVDFRSYPLKNTLPSIRILGQALQREAVAERYIDFYQKNMDKVTSITQKIEQDKKPKVFIELKAATSESCCSTAGNGNMGDFIDLAGGHNIAKALLPSSLGTVNLEKIIATDPDIYIASGSVDPNSNAPGLVMGAATGPQQALTSASSVLSRKGINTLRAVKDGNTHGIWHGFYNSPQNVLAIQMFAKWFYPEQFKELDPQQVRAQLHSEFLAIEPTGTLWLDSLNQQ